MGKRRTHDDFINDLALINEDIQILSVFNGVMKPIDCKCFIDGNEWTTLPSRLLLGSGCPICARKKLQKGKH